MSAQRDSEDTDQNVDADQEVRRFAEEILACRRWSARRQRCEALTRDRSGEELEAFAELLKSQEFDDGRLHTQVAEARVLAVTLHLLGKIAQRPRIIALGLLARGDAARQRSQNGTALALSDRAAEVFLHAGDQVGWARARAGRLLAASWAGCLSESMLEEMGAVRQVLREARQPNRLANLEQNIGLAWLQLSRFQEALAAFEDGLATLATIAPPQLLPAADGHGLAARPTPKKYANLRGMLLANKAMTLLWFGDVEAAMPLFDQAYALFSSVKNEGYRALIAMYRAIHAGQSGEVREALMFSRQAVSGLRAAGMDAYAGGALKYCAEILLQLNRDAEADATLSEAIALLRAGQSPHELCLALGMRARILAHRGQYDPSAYGEALACLDEAARLAESIRYVGTVYHITLERAELLLRMGQAAEAKEAALALFQAPAAENELDRARALVIATEATLAHGTLSLASTMAQALIQRGEEFGAPEMRYRGHCVLARAAHRGERHTEALAHYDAACMVLRSTIDELVSDQRASFLQDKDTLYGEACLVALEADAPLRAMTYLERARARAIWRTRLDDSSTDDALIGEEPAHQERQKKPAREQDDLEDLLRRHRALSALLRTPLPDDLMRGEATRKLALLSQQILEQLAARAERERESEVFDGETLMARIPRQTTALAYALIDDTLVTFMIADQRIVAVHRHPGGARQVRRLERELRLRVADLTRQGCSDERALTADMLAHWTNGWQATMRALWALLIAPVEQFLPPDGEPLTIIPHHLLRALPLAALHDGTRYLIERWVVRSVPSLRACGVTPPPPPPLFGRQPLLALGYSDGGTLPQAAEQASAMARILGGIALTEAEATGARLRTECKGRAYLHLSAHGEWRLDLPYASFIQLADGPFHPTDVLLLDLRGCRLVSLSACQTGKGQPSGGDAYIGLAQAFHEAGAEAVLATLWRVEAQATRAFMERFYKQLATGAMPALALRAAQLACLREPPGSLLASPYGWAGFQLTEYAPRLDASMVEPQS